MLICLNVFLIFRVGSLSFGSKSFIDKMCVMVIAFAAKTMSGATFHPLVFNNVDERLVFCGFPIEGFCSNLVIIIREFCKLYGEFWCRYLWWG